MVQKRNLVTLNNTNSVSVLDVPASNEVTVKPNNQLRNRHLPNFSLKTLVKIVLAVATTKATMPLLGRGCRQIATNIWKCYSSICSECSSDATRTGTVIIIRSSLLNGPWQAFNVTVLALRIKNVI